VYNLRSVSVHRFCRCAWSGWPGMCYASCPDRVQMRYPAIFAL